MKRGDKVFITRLITQEALRYTCNKRIEVVGTEAKVVNVLEGGIIEYQFQGGSFTSEGKIGFDCFKTLEEAEEIAEEVNNKFKKDFCYAYEPSDDELETMYNKESYNERKEELDLHKAKILDDYRNGLISEAELNAICEDISKELENYSTK